MSEPHDRRLRLIATLVVVILAFIAFIPSVANSFALDDTLARAKNDGVPNRSIAELGGPGRYFTSDYWDGIGVRSGLYRPATIYSFALTHHCVPRSIENEAVPHHVINVLLNCLAAYLVLWLMLDFGLALRGALLVSALFAVHAVHSEVVATVVGRAELLAFCFGLLGLRNLCRGQPGNRAWRLPLASICFFLAFCSKESALAWVGFVPCYAAARAWRAGDGPTARSVLGATWKQHAAVLIPALALFFALRHVAISGSIQPIHYAANPLCYTEDSVRWLTGLANWGYGFWLCIAPFSLACLYGPQAPALVESAGDVRVIATALAFATWLATALWRPARRPGLFLAAALFFGFAFITSNLPFAIGTIFAERLFFAPSLGVCMLAGLLFEKLGATGKKVLIGTCLAWVVTALVVDVQRSLVWRDNESLFTHESTTHPDCALLQLTAAKYFHVLEFEQPAQQARFRGLAWTGVRRAKTLDPDYVDAYALEASLLEREGEVDAAIATLQTALTIPRLPYTGREAAVRKHLGRLLITAKKQTSRGLAECLRSLELEPGDTDLRIRTIDFGMTALPRDVVLRLIEAGRKREPTNPVLAVQHADLLARTPGKTVQLLSSITAILGDVFAGLAQRHHGEYRFVVARMQFAECLAALGRTADARRELQTVATRPTASPALKARAAQMLQSLPR